MHGRLRTSNIHGEENFLFSYDLKDTLLKQSSQNFDYIMQSMKFN